MKTWKLIAGILSMAFFGIVVFQSCAAGLSNALQNNGEVSGTAGLLVAFLMLAGGIISVVTRKKDRKSGNVALIVVLGVAALIGFANYGSYGDLAIWSGWCLINALIAALSMAMEKKKTKNKRLNREESAEIHE